MDNAELVWIARAHHGSDEIRGPHERRASSRAAARRLARGAPGVEESSDHWPGSRAAGRPARVAPAYDPQAEPYGESGQDVVSFAARFDGDLSAPPAVLMSRILEHPLFVAQIFSAD